VTGAAAPARRTRADGGTEDVPAATTVALGPGDELRLGTPRHGLRCYVAVSGGLVVPEVLGSRSTDLLSGLGPPPLEPGTRLPLGPAPGTTRPDHATATPAPARAPRGAATEGDGGTELPVSLGPRDSWFDDAAAQLRAGTWTVSPTSNRIGVRLDGTALRRRAGHRDRELPTEAVVTGAVQVPPDGRPVIFLNDHPTTGGYPVVAVVHPDALPLLAQARPGTPVRLNPGGTAPGSA
ncbi:MAG TPA: biotin-dependent carboxyltransferase family protein, partial [Pseudonocardiaceae bacterium]